MTPDQWALIYTGSLIGVLLIAYVFSKMDNKRK